MPQVVAIFGPPGAGKTTAAEAVRDAFGWVCISSGDIARAVDPGAIERGEMADREKLRNGFHTVLRAALDEGYSVVCDGIPRDPTDVELFPDGTTFLLLNVRPDIGTDRQVRRMRDAADTAELAAKRTVEQRALMELDAKPEDSWAYKLADWTRSISTDRMRALEVANHVLDYIAGERRTLA